MPGEKLWKNRQRVLVIASRGISSKDRHLVNDITELLAHGKKDSKVERKTVKSDIDDLCFDRSCNNFLYFEQRKRKDLYLWIGKSPSGPSFLTQV